MSLRGNFPFEQLHLDHVGMFNLVAISGKNGIKAAVFKQLVSLSCCVCKTQHQSQSCFLKHFEFVCFSNPVGQKEQKLVALQSISSRAMWGIFLLNLFWIMMDIALGCCILPTLLNQWGFFLSLFCWFFKNHFIGYI